MFQQLAAFLLPIATQVLIASCKGAVAIGFVLICRRMLGARLSAAGRHLLWLAVLACLILPFGFTMRVLPAADSAPVHGRVVPAPADGASSARLSSPPTSPSPLAGPLAVPPGDSAVHLLPVSDVIPPSAVDSSLREWLLLLWATVALVLGAVTIWNLRRYQRITAHAAPVAGAAHHLLLQCKESMGLQRKVGLLESDDIPAPAVLGWWSPVLLLPAGLHQRLETSQLRHVFLHELAHVRRHDVLSSWLAAAAQVLHWFNPVVWYALRAMRSDMEQACDAEAMRRLAPDERAGYGQTLIGMLDACPGRLPVHGLGVVESHRQLKARITAIAGFDSRRAGLSIVAMLPVLVVASMAAVEPGAGPPQIDAGNAMHAAAAAAVPLPATPFPSARPTRGAEPGADASPAGAPPLQPQSTVPSVAPEALTFTVRIRFQHQMQSDRDGGILADTYIKALGDRLRAIPGLVLLGPASADQRSADFEIAINIIAPDFNDAARLVVTATAGRDSLRARMLAELISNGRYPIAYTVRQDDPDFNLDRDIDRLRMTVFPQDPSATREIRARLLDPTEPFDRRRETLGLLLDFDRASSSAPPEPEVIRLGARFAASLAIPRQRQLAWSQLAATGSPEVPLLLAPALTAEGDPDARWLMVHTAAAWYDQDPRIRAVLETMSRTDPQDRIREAALQVLGRTPGPAQ